MEQQISELPQPITEQPTNTSSTDAELLDCICSCCKVLSPGPANTCYSVMRQIAECLYNFCCSCDDCDCDDFDCDADCDIDCDV